MKQLLIEKILFSPDKTKCLTLNENTNDLPQKFVALYRFPISRCDEENKNGRVYPRTLWQGVIQRKEAERSIGLLDHPDSGDGSIKDIFCTYKNMRIEGNTVYADAYLIGDNGKYIHELIQGGSGIVGLSTVGMGEFIEGTNIVNPNTFTYERCDAVINPSAGIYANTNDRIDTKTLQVAESQKPRKFKTETSYIRESVVNGTYKSPLKRRNAKVIDYVKEQSKFFKIVRDNRTMLESIKSYPDVVKQVRKLKQSIVNEVLR